MAVFSAIAASAWGAAFAATTIGSVTIAVGQAVMWSLASAALFKPKVNRQTVQATINQPDQPRIRAYGRNLLGGVRAFYESVDDILFQVVVVNHGRVNGLKRFWFNGEPMGEGFKGGELKRYVILHFRDGSGAGGDYQDVRNGFGKLWTEDHRLQGQATFYAGFGDPSDGNFNKVFPKAADTPVQVEIEGVMVPTITGGDLVYSDNAGMCLHDLMTNADGWNIGRNFIDAASWQAFVDLSDQPVPLAAGGTEPRYRLSGYYALDDALKEVTGRMLATCDGQIYQTAEGKVGILGGAWSEPDVTLTEDDIQSIEMGDGFDPFTDYNILQGTFVSPEHNYQPIEVGEYRDNVALALQDERADMLDVDMCPSSGQLQRLMKIKYAKDHREQVGTITTNLVGMKARFPKGDGIHTIRIDAPRLGLSGVFEVTSHTFSIPDRRCTIGIASIENPYPWDAVAEERPLPPTREELQNPPPAEKVPEGIVLTQERVSVLAGVNGVKLVVEVGDPPSDGYELKAQIAQGDIANVNPALEFGDRRWTEMPSSGMKAESGLLDDGQTYTVRVQWDGRGPWVKAGVLQVIAQPSAPPPPTQLSALWANDAAYVEWVNGGLGYYQTQVLMAALPDASAAVSVGVVEGNVGRPDNLTVDLTGQTGTRYVWVRGVNRSGVPSGLAGPVSIRIPDASDT